MYRCPYCDAQFCEEEILQAKKEHAEVEVEGPHVVCIIGVPVACCGYLVANGQNGLEWYRENVE